LPKPPFTVNEVAAYTKVFVVAIASAAITLANRTGVLPPVGVMVSPAEKVIEPKAYAVSIEDRVLPMNPPSAAVAAPTKVVAAVLLDEINRPVPANVVVPPIEEV
jgi:hypothetical protein